MTHRRRCKDVSDQANRVAKKMNFWKSRPLQKNGLPITNSSNFLDFVIYQAERNSLANGIWLIADQLASWEAYEVCTCMHDCVYFNFESLLRI
jgi:hypothetical protein